MDKEMSYSFLAYATMIAVPVFIAPIEEIKDIKGEVVYLDDNSSFFLIVDHGKFYIGRPRGAVSVVEADVAYTWGEVRDCSNLEVSCKRLGAQIFARGKGRGRTLSYADGTAVSAWTVSRGWAGAGVWPAYCSGGDSGGGCQTNLPNLTYQYETDSAGVVNHIMIVYWRLHTGKPITYDLKLKTKKGIQL